MNKNEHKEVWQIDSWMEYPIKQQPEYENKEELKAIINEVNTLPAIVNYIDIKLLEAELCKVANKEAFLLQGGDCAESFIEFNEINLFNTIKAFLEMSDTLKKNLQKPIVTIARMAGQFAKPRTYEYEEKNGIVLPSYRGDMINDLAFDANARKPDPKRLIYAYHQSIKTYNLANSILKKLGKNEKEFFFSHEGLLLSYEQALVRYFEEEKKYYAGSAHMLWIGDRTKNINEAHIEFMRGISNPLGIKLGISTKEDELIRLIDILNPENKAGKITLITRMGADHIEKILPNLVKKVIKEGKKVIWSCDPMHGNTIKLSSGLKTRSFDKILSEVKKFFVIHKSLGSYPGGLHLEMTGQSVTECIGGKDNISAENLPERYYTHCDPRLNYNQSIELASLITKEL